jgi:hypothetical protein
MMNRAGRWIMLAAMPAVAGGCQIKTPDADAQDAPNGTPGVDAQDASNTKAPAAATSNGTVGTPNGESPPPVVDQGATQALSRMGDYLRTLKAFRIQAVVSTEEVLQDGQKVEITNRVDVLAERPNRLRVELQSDRKQRVFFFDGKSFTLFAPRQKFYAVVPAPATINELAKMLEEKYGIDLPLVDLFRWGSPEASFADIKAAKDFGSSVVDGVTTDHYGFRQDGLDWQVWIQSGAHPLPKKLVLTTTTDESRPQHSATYTWNLAPSYNTAAFEFTPADDVKRIPIAEVAKLRATAASNGGSNR